jgi:hypothetical protein
MMMVVVAVVVMMMIMIMMLGKISPLERSGHLYYCLRKTLFYLSVIYFLSRSSYCLSCTKTVILFMLEFGPAFQPTLQLPSSR